MIAKPYLIALGVLALLLFGGWMKGIYDEAGQADILRQQIAATAERIDRQNALAKKAEAEMQADRLALATLNKKWTAIRAQKDRAVCQLDADAVRVLKDASAAHPAAR
ncbi:hypothetical protein GobsT_50940 [Gemmata obscuriglobus]|uniref:Uncharacterized protein n=1 Tax=Gemmata obscuriglobus TaxID=114 RepID=A0A2Z3GRL5_9BACT|nr:hypothetical protein [Gemmata obscuriglobus]AWM37009.1 hypothetical protein C1280_08240 [Gemmata obscuriglobus]QEG30290.1 hypothetical protein GobsT_50940 [Gemmata obscuriglobus]VTS09614.1 unnamed protein product [Gemmata obscuriglobus UQM 2246]